MLAVGAGAVSVGYFEAAIEVGEIAESAVEGDLENREIRFQDEAARVSQAHFGEELREGAAGGLVEGPAKIGGRQVYPFSQVAMRKIFVKVFKNVLTGAAHAIG